MFYFSVNRHSNIQAIIILSVFLGPVAGWFFYSVCKYLKSLFWRPLPGVRYRTEIGNGKNDFAKTNEVLSLNQVNRDRKGSLVHEFSGKLAYVKIYKNKKQLESLYKKTECIADLFGKGKSVEPIGVLVEDELNLKQIQNAALHYMTAIESYRLAAAKLMVGKYQNSEEVWPKWAEKVSQKVVDPEVRAWVHDGFSNCQRRVC